MSKVLIREYADDVDSDSPAETPDLTGFEADEVEEMLEQVTADTRRKSGSGKGATDSLSKRQRRRVARQTRTKFADDSDNDDDDDDKEEQADEQAEQEDGDAAFEEAPMKKAKAASTARLSGRAGMADAMAKVLRRALPQGAGQLLYKEKTDRQRAAAAAAVAADGSSDSEQDEAAKRRALDSCSSAAQRAAAASRRAWENQARERVTSGAAERDQERPLRRTACRGVVQFFNSVYQEQKQVRDQLEGSGTEAKRQRLLSSLSKNDFLDMLGGGGGAAAAKSKLRKAKKEAAAASTASGRDGDAALAEEQGWDVLKDDFVDRDEASSEDGEDRKSVV